MGADEDRADVARVLEGNPLAFEGIVRRWQGPIVNLAFRFCNDRGRAEEMAQEVFVRAWRGLATWRKEGAFSTWLFALATNVYRTELRRIPVRNVPLEEARGLRMAHDKSTKLAEAQRDEIVRKSVATLPEKYRDVMVVFYFRDQDVSETALTLSLPEGTIKARLARGRDLLRTKLERLL